MFLSRLIFSIAFFQTYKDPGQLACAVCAVDTKFDIMGEYLIDNLRINFQLALWCISIELSVLVILC